MKNYTQLKLNSAFVFACFSLIMLSSCGSYQYVGSTSDGIYSEDEPEYVVIEDVSYQEEPNSNYYSNYFREKALEVESTEDVDPVFTDVDSYESQSNINSNQNAGWGDNSSQVNINVYDSGWNNWGWGYPYNGWNNWGWNRPFGWNYGYGWNSWGWNNWGWNSGFYGGYYGGLHPFYGYGYGFYGNPYYGYNGFRNNYAYSTSRRGSSNGYLNRNYAPNSRSSSLLNRRGSTTSNGTRVNSQPRGRTESSTRPRVNNSSNQPRTSSPRYNTPRKNTPRTSTPRTSTPRTSTPRSSTPRATTPRSSTPRSYSTPRSNSSYSSPRSSSSSSSRRPR